MSPKAEIASSYVDYEGNLFRLLANDPPMYAIFPNRPGNRAGQGITGALPPGARLVWSPSRGNV